MFSADPPNNDHPHRCGRFADALVHISLNNLCITCGRLCIFFERFAPANMLFNKMHNVFTLYSQKNFAEFAWRARRSGVYPQYPQPLLILRYLIYFMIFSFHNSYYAAVWSDDYEFPSWEGQGVGGDIYGVFTSATHPKPLPRGELLKCCVTWVHKWL